MRLKRLILILIIGILFGGLIMYFILSPKEKEEKIEISHNMIVEKVEALGNLEVVKFSIQDLMEYKKVRQWLPNAKTAIVVVGEVVGCIDLTKITPEDIYTSGDSIRINLPAPEICHVKIDHSKSHIYHIDYGLWESEQIADEAYRYAEKQLYQQAMEMDITTQSRNNAHMLLYPILQSMGFKEILISFKTNNTSYDEKNYQK